MAKKTNQKKIAGKKNQAMNTATKIFAAGACAEIYLLAVYRYYVQGTVSQVLTWHNRYLPALPWIGAALVAVGLLLLFTGAKTCEKKTAAARILVGAGVFAAVTAPMIRAWYTAALTPLCVVVPGIMILGIAWFLYDRECVYALMALCGAALILWVCRECLPVPAQRLAVRVLAALWLVLSAAAVVFVKKLCAAGGKFRDTQLLAESADYPLLYAAIGISALLVLAGMFTPVLAYYAMWAAAVVIFAIAVYYTVQQL
ncbi:MAG: hypothetical protein E7445_08225 [Ruminococcaceae bacterium]|nr:hypothetical protein [Oscillospiraceae bacterium]